MSQVALKEYENALREQHTRNEARRIRTRVAEARGNPHSAAVRWPFELLQNALDVGPRVDKSSVRIRIKKDATKVVFEHDGAPFTSVELAALLSGGSSKEFESETTTGRFGTGFLVTHVLAEQTKLQGLLAVESGYEQFVLTLDRSGDEDSILSNIQSCNNSILSATSIINIADSASACFEYPIINDNNLELGFDALKKALPYLYITRPSLGNVEIEIGDGNVDQWSADTIVRNEIKGGYVEFRTVSVSHNGVDAKRYRINRFLTDEKASAGALVLFELIENGWSVVQPDVNLPRVYREYPVRGSGFVPINFILDGKFEPDQERARLLMSNSDKTLIENALDAAVVGIKYIFEKEWKNAHTLAYANRPLSSFDISNGEEIKWWTHRLASFAEKIARLPIVQCSNKYLCAIHPDECADFIIPRLLNSSLEDETTVTKMWPLVNASKDLDPPVIELALEWTQLATGWHNLGVEISLITVTVLAEWVRNDAVLLDDLRVECNSAEWLTKYLDLVGECWSNRNGIELSVLTKMLPNQNLQLCSPSELHRDDGISENLKDISHSVGNDIRSQLLYDGIIKINEELRLTHVRSVIHESIKSILSEKDVIHKTTSIIQNKLPEEKDCAESSFDIQIESVKLLCHLWQSGGVEYSSFARQVPLITSKGRSVRWSPDRMMMAPVLNWDVAARPFSNAYPPHRILADLYVGQSDQNIPNCVDALIAWEIAIGDPISTDTPVELKDRRLKAICLSDSSGIIVTGEKFSQVALLHPELLNRCEGVDEAKALFGLILCHIARNDPTWKTVRTVKGKKAGEEIDISVRNALWLADLKYRAWVPMPNEEGKSAKLPANETTLKTLLEPLWLVKNDSAIKLLSEWFGFDELELRLLGIEPDEAKRQELRNNLAKLVETGGADPSIYSSLVEEIEARRRKGRDVIRCRQLGIAVQEAIKSALETYGLSLELVDRGFDYEISLPSDNLIEDISMKYEIGSYLLEIKATTTGHARMTPAQAKTATEEYSHYILCVVDLRGIAEEQLDEPWTIERVTPLAFLVTDIGNKVRQTHHLIQQARMNSVSIKNESALRYEVPFEVWQIGISIPNWVSSISIR